MKRKQVIVGLLVFLGVILTLAGAFIIYGLYRFAHPIPLVVENADSMPPKIARKFRAEIWGFPTTASSVYAYSSQRLKGDAFLRFHLSDHQEFDKFKKGLLSSGSFSGTAHPKISKRDIEHIMSWWDLDRTAMVHKAAYWFFGFDDNSGVVYVIRRID